MHAIVTGANGTVGRALTRAIREAGGTVTPWDRSTVPIDDYFAMERFIQSTRPDVVFHLAIPSRPTGRDNEHWLVNWHWPSELAWITSQNDIPFVFTSTVLVFTNNVTGPIHPSTQPDAEEGYGGDKRRAEERVRFQNPESRVVRLGWQIADAPGSNNMIDYLESTNARDGVVRASRRWFPACSFVADTAAALIAAVDAPPDTYMLDGNAVPGLDFFTIASRLNTLHGNRWKIEATDDFVLDQRMIDPRLPIAPLTARL